jgi:hypothetical protein
MSDVLTGILQILIAIIMVVIYVYILITPSREYRRGDFGLFDTVIFTAGWVMMPIIMFIIFGQRIS